LITLSALLSEVWVSPRMIQGLFSMVQVELGMWFDISSDSFKVLETLTFVSGTVFVATSEFFISIKSECLC
jgi:hypothetical protein